MHSQEPLDKKCKTVKYLGTVFIEGSRYCQCLEICAIYFFVMSPFPTLFSYMVTFFYTEWKTFQFCFCCVEILCVFCSKSDNKDSRIWVAVNTILFWYVPRPCFLSHLNRYFIKLNCLSTQNKQWQTDDLQGTGNSQIVWFLFLWFENSTNCTKFSDFILFLNTARWVDFK